MENVKQYKSYFGNTEVTFTVDENLNKLIGKNLAPKKLAKANKDLSKLKFPLPGNLNMIKRISK